MMKLGIIEIDESQHQHMDTLGKMSGYDYVYIKNKEECVQGDILVIYAGEGEHFLEICDWLLKIKENGRALIWLILTDINNKEIDIYLQLGINGWVNGLENMERLIRMIGNMTKHFYLTRKQENKEVPEFSLNERNSSVVIENGEEIKLTRLEYQTLMILAEKENMTVTYKEIGKDVWGKDYVTDQQYRVANIIFHLRNKLGSYGKSHIQTVRSKGYRLIL